MSIFKEFKKDYPTIHDSILALVESLASGITDNEKIDDFETEYPTIYKGIISLYEKIIFEDGSEDEDGPEDDDDLENSLEDENGLEDASEDENIRELREEYPTIYQFASTVIESRFLPVKKTMETLKSKIHGLNHQSLFSNPESSNNPLNDIYILKWILLNRHENNSNVFFSKGVVTTGSGPFQEDDFDNILHSLGIGIYYSYTEINTMIIGERDWSEDAVRAMINKEECKVYTQHMALIAILFGLDCHNDDTILERLKENHPAFEYIDYLKLDWPETEIIDGDDGNNFDPDTWPKVGLLSHMGYKVGINRITFNKRKHILSTIFENNIPNVVSTEYMEKWGTQNTSKRLQKLANSIATFARLAKKKNNPDLADAINDWEKDLDWLKETYFIEEYYFDWPSPSGYEFVDDSF